MYWFSVPCFPDSSSSYFSSPPLPIFPYSHISTTNFICWTILYPHSHPCRSPPSLTHTPPTPLLPTSHSEHSPRMRTQNAPSYPHEVMWQVRSCPLSSPRAAFYCEHWSEAGCLGTSVASEAELLAEGNSSATPPWPLQLPSSPHALISPHHLSVATWPLGYG